MDEVKLYSIIGTDSKFYDNVQAAKDAGTEPMAIVVCLGDTKRAERGKDWNGLAMALDKLPEKYMYIDEEHWNDECQPATFKVEQATSDFTGWATTQTLVGGCGKDHDHQAAKACNSYGDTRKLTARQSEFSSWFLPGYGQWVAVLKGMDVNCVLRETVIAYMDNGTMEEGFKKAGVENLWEFLQRHYEYEEELNVWTSTAGNSINAYPFQMLSSINIDGISVDEWAIQKNTPANVIPFIAFKYGGGGTIDQ
jgi:hypothetical protein